LVRHRFRATDQEFYHCLLFEYGDGAPTTCCVGAKKPGLALDTRDAFEALDAMKLRPQEFKASHLVWSLPFVQGGMA